MVFVHRQHNQWASASSTLPTTAMTFQVERVDGGYRATPVGNIPDGLSPQDVAGLLFKALFQPAPKTTASTSKYTPEAFQEMTEGERVQSFFQILSQNPDADFTKTAEQINDWLDMLLFDKDSLGDSTVAYSPDAVPMPINLMHYYNYLKSIGVDTDMNEFVRNCSNVYRMPPSNGSTRTRYQYAVSDADRKKYTAMGASPMAAEIVAAAKARTDGITKGGGWCARGVRLTFEDLGIYGVQAGSAYQLAAVLEKDDRFIEVSYHNRRPSDTVIFPPRYTPDQHGKTHPDGHAEVVLPDGLASSDYQAKERDPDNYGPEGPRVFRYIGKQPRHDVQEA